MNYNNHPDSNGNSNDHPQNSALVISASATNELAITEMVGVGESECLSAPNNIGFNNSDQSGNHLNGSSAPSMAVIDSVTESRAPSTTGLTGARDSVSVSKQSQATSSMTSTPINIFFNRDSGEQGQRAVLDQHNKWS